MAQTGNLEVLVIAANNLKDVETFGRMDPYTVLELSGQKFKTKSKTDAGKTPTWNERFTFINVSPQYSTELMVKVYDRNVMLSDTEIGSGRLTLSNIYQVGTQEVRLQLTTSKHKSAGELQMLLTWKPLMTGARPAAQPQVVVLQQPQPVMVAPPQAAYGVPPPAAYGAPPAPGYGVPPPPAYGAHPGYAAPPPGYPAQAAGYRGAPAQHPQQPASSLYPQLYQPPSV